jgi:uncharacterized coiled-coil protein SlyX
MGRILKGIAIAAGAGLALGVSATLRSRRALYHNFQRDDQLLHLEPLFDRFDRIEERMGAVESRPVQEMADFERRLAEQESALREVRAGVEETDRRLVAQTEIAGSRLAQLRAEIPRAVEASLDTRMAALEASLRVDIEARQKQNLDSIERTIDQKISERISALEKTLAEQSASIAVLRLGAETADANLHRLIGSVERLCESAQIAQAREHAPASFQPGSFQEELAHSMRGPRLVADAAAEERKPRIPMARILVGALAFGIARFLR